MTEKRLKSGPERPKNESGSMLSVVLRDHGRRYGLRGEFATKVETSRGTFSNLITGRKPPYGETFDKIAEDMGVAPETLRLLGSVTVRQAMNLVIEKQAQDNEE